MGASTPLKPAARKEPPEGGAGAQIPTASKMETLSAGPSPPAPGHLKGDTGGDIHVAQPEAPGFAGYLPRLP